MAERTSWAVGSDAERILTVEDARIAWAGLLTPARSGFRPVGNADPGRVFATSPTPNGRVHVEPFTYHLQSARGGGVYTMTLDTVHDVDILGAAPPDSANTRHDLIVAQQSDVYFGDPDSRMRVRRFVGDPSGAPQDPPIPGSPDVIRLARVVVPANATAITHGNIQGLRPVDRVTVGLGGVLPVPDQTARNTITGPYEGLTIYRRDRRWLEVFDGTGWRVVGTAVGTSAADRDAAITNPYDGQLAVTTDTNTLWQRRTGIWVTALDAPTFHLRRAATQPILNTTFTAINFDTEDDDSHNGHSTAANTDRYTSQKAGVYDISGAVAFEQSSTGIRLVRLTLNGTPINGSSGHGPNLGEFEFSCAATRSVRIRLAVNDIIRLEVWHNHGATLNTGTVGYVQPSLSGQWIKP